MDKTDIYALRKDDMMQAEAITCYHKDDNIRMNSSSGGVFYELACFVISQNGVVFGASFDYRWHVIHDCAESMVSCKRFCGSKYVQSDIGDTYSKARNYLDSGRMVLFSGTPCQIAGLKSFLDKEYDNLITVDFVCHGVPSPKVWEKYLCEIAKNRAIKNVNFRDKTEGWLDYSLKIDFMDGTTYRKNLKEDLYMRGFLQNIYLRPICYQCPFKGDNMQADITLGDFWGVQKILPQMYDNRGTSLVFLHSPRGVDIWETVAKKMKVCLLNENEALKYNVAMTKSAQLTKKRDIFYESEIVNFDTLKRLTRIPFLQQIKKKVKIVVHFINKG